MSGTAICVLAAAAGFVPIRQRSGGHQRFVHPDFGAYLNLQPLPDGTAKVDQVVQLLRAIDELGLWVEGKA
jgi:predicted RNA binding protein YcfA (HicA-like mRNA interferase family)